MPYAYEYQHRVAFSETDLAGIMHFSNFFRLMENAEHAFFRSLGTSVHPEGTQSGWPRVEAQCNYQKPLRFEDEVTVALNITQVSSKAISYRFDFLKNGTVHASGTLTTVHIKLNNNGEMKACELPNDLKEQLSKLIHNEQL